ncbi:Sapep family Mn(2+)-dependent dipeptidase [Clostridium sp. AN503]|uniref:Sapep family Mn(2+)-dependent dipeptidase n=1 Tax=Clostridium sp. AN503 TaxID=3160598 RepID=UPI0034598DE4
MTNGFVDLEDTILKKVDELGDSMIESIRELVRIGSVEEEAEPDMPFGCGVRDALHKALSISESLGFSTVNLENHIGYAQYGRGEDYVCAIGHVDVVPVGEGWVHPPFSAYMENGTIYGRGVLDNKGPVLACLYGLAALKELELPMKHPVRIIFGCDEESGFEDLTYYLSKERPPVYGFTPDCKYPVVYSERGRAKLRIDGNAADLERFFSFVNTYFISAKNTGDRLGIDYSNPEYGIMEMRGYELHADGCEEPAADACDVLQAGQAKAGRVSFHVTLSYPLGITIDEIVARVEAKASPEGLSVALLHNYDPVVFEKDSPMVRALQESYEKVTGMDGTPVTTTGGTYAKAMPGIVPFGPSFPGQKGIGHNPNEWMTVEDLITNAKIYALALYKLAQL